LAKKTTPPLTYKAAGVDIDAGDALVERIKPLAASTARSGADAALGGFGALFDIKAAGFKDPVLVASTDGVGSKVKVALEAGDFSTVGIDLVAMCVNDLIVQGAEPLFFLDYYATGKLDLAAAAKVIAGIAEGCREAECALIGGETAEMPGLYHGADFDLAGFAVGAAERDALLDPRRVKPGDVVIGLPSSGLHSNGFSLVRKLVEHEARNYTDTDVFHGQKASLAEELLKPTRIYVKALKPLLKARLVKTLAHVTGGGLLDNLPRSLAPSTRAMLDASTWQPQPILTWIREGAHLSPYEMLRTFNCGIGMAVIVSPDAVDNATSHFKKHGEQPLIIGKIERSDNKEPTCEVLGPQGWLGGPKAFLVKTGDGA
jgi:phosphoribosylformylglycinamidine cyclo-ligase